MCKPLRVFIALFLCCTLLFINGPVRAHAAGFTPGLYALDATNLLIGGARALGIGPGDDPLHFNNLITDAKNALFSGISPLVNVWLDYVNNGFRAFLSADFLSNLLSFFFDSGTVELSDGFATSFSVTTPSYPGSTVVISSTVPFRVGYYSVHGYYRYICWSHSSGYVRYDSSGSTMAYMSSEFNGLYVDGGRNTTSAWADPANFSGMVYLGDFSDVNFGGTKLLYELKYLAENVLPSLRGVSTSADLTLDNVGSSLSDSVYSDWTAGSITQENQPYFPVSIPSLSDSTAISTQTQAQAQVGTVPDSVADEIIAGADVVPETGTIADVITAVRALGADIVAAVQAIPAAIADIFSLAADPEVYQVDLKDFFPFCIPFDLFDIVTAFAAEPEAPVFEWPISVPRWGLEYTLKVDLQEWEDIASLFRTLELTIFCVGLAIVTREKFLRS